MCGGVLLALKGLVMVALAGIPHSVYEVCGLIAELGIFIALGKKMLGLAPMYNRARVWLFIVSIAALLFAMTEPGHCNAALFIQKGAQLFMLLYYLMVWKPLHGPFARCPWRWAFGIKGLVVCFLFGKWMTCVIPDACFESNGWWVTIGLSGVVLTFIAMVMAAANRWDAHGTTFLTVYGLGNLAMGLSNLAQYSAPALCITTAICAVVVWSFGEKLYHWLRHRKDGKGEVKTEVLIVVAVLKVEPVVSGEGEVKAEPKPEPVNEAANA